MPNMFGFFLLRDLDGDSADRVRDILRGLRADVEVDFDLEPIEPPPTNVDPQPTNPLSVGPAWAAAPGIFRTLIAQHFPRAAWEHTALIANCESGFNPRAHNTAGEDSRGWFQINVVPAANPDLLALGDLFDPAVNVRAARIVWGRQGWRAWLNCARATGVGATGPGVA